MITQHSFDTQKTQRISPTCLVSVVLGVEPRALHMLGKSLTSEIYLSLSCALNNVFGQKKL